MSFSVYEENLLNENLTDYLFAEKQVKSEPLLRLKSSCFDLLSKLILQDFGIYFSFIEFLEKQFNDPCKAKVQHGLLFALEQLEIKDFVISTPIRLFSEETWTQITTKSGMPRSAFISNFKSRIIENVLFPGLKSNSVYVRSKTCQLVGSMDQPIWTSSAQLVPLCELVCRCLSENNEVTRITSLQAIEYLVLSPECLPLLKASLPVLIAKILEMLKLANLNDVIKSLYQIVRQFNKDVVQFSMSIVQTLLSSFYETIQALGSDDKISDFEFEKDETRNSLETSILTLNEILLLDLPQEFYINSRNWVYNLLSQVLSTPSLSYLIDSTLKLFNSLLFNLFTFDAETWFFFPFICYILLENHTFDYTKLPQIEPKAKALLEKCQFAVLHAEIPDYHRFLGILNQAFSGCTSNDPKEFWPHHRRTLSVFLIWTWSLRVFLSWRMWDFLGMTRSNSLFCSSWSFSWLKTVSRSCPLLSKSTTPFSKFSRVIWPLMTAAPWSK